MSYIYYITANDGANFTITDGSDGATGEFDGCVCANTGGEATIVGATIRSAECSGGSITIESGTFTRGIFCNSGSVAIEGGTFNEDLHCTGGTIEISGGTFYGSVSFSGADSITIIGGIFYSLPTVDENSISESYYTTQEDSGGATYYEVNYASGE